MTDAIRIGAAGDDQSAYEMTLVDGRKSDESGPPALFYRPCIPMTKPSM